MTNPVYNLQSIVPTPPASLRGTFREDEKPEEDFIKLMVAQLQNQDPEKPMDGTALISQRASPTWQRTRMSFARTSSASPRRSNTIRALPVHARATERTSSRPTIP